ncbi:ABC transporter ATP-binding protein [Paenibacillus sedimenti]|uniref:ABC transporter ATP-binding protein n=1 Tax=Paenibacillus sedimenti TaxID=2770274 RepID=A0A926QM21_9BACL|nr:ABC transporter ATP-binding protein [Paenibacillus sedimenti]MBD0384235.1 ABC transporter ATP-binding protein [Paenibacillus sedimenti]
MKRNQTVLSMTNISVDLETATRKTRLVNKVSLNVNRGEVLGIIGESGSGKTMTCMAAMGLLPRGARVTEGSILLDGEELTSLSVEERRKLRGSRISMIMQNPMTCFNPVRTIGSHFLETLGVHTNLTAKEARERAIHDLGQVNLPRPQELMRQYPFELSGGMLQRIMIAIALATNAELIIADEPTTALDTGNQKHILRELNRIREMTGAAIIVITHDLGVIAELADQVTVMYRGESVENAPVKQLFDAPAHAYTRLLLQSRLSMPNSASDEVRRGLIV